MLMGRLSVDREQLNKYIHYALTQDLLTKQGRKYTATDKGLMLLELFIKLKDFFGLPQK